MKRLLLLLLLLVPFPALAVVAFDAATSGSNNGGTTSSLTWSHTSTGSDRFGYVGVVGDVIGGADDVTGVTWGGSAMTFVTKITTDIAASGVRYMYVYRIVGQSTGSQSITVSASTNHYLLATSASYSGVDQTNPVNASTTNQSSSASSNSLTTNLSATDGTHSQTTSTSGGTNTIGISHISIAIKPATGSLYWMLTFAHYGPFAGTGGGSTKRVEGSFSILGMWDDEPAPAGNCTGSGASLGAPTWADVQACHDFATTPGATITVTAGTYTAHLETVITKWVKIVCAGSRTCLVSDDFATIDGPDVLDISESTAGSTRLEGFKFTVATNHQGTSAAVSMNQSTGGKPILIYNNEFVFVNNVGNAIRAITNKGVIWGNLVTGTMNSTPTNCNNSNAFIRHGQVPVTTEMGGISFFGTADTGFDQSLYVENNTITNMGEAIDIDKGGRIIIRFNTITNFGIVHHDGSNPSARSSEIYKNTFVLDLNTAQCPGSPGFWPNQQGWINYRAGTGFLIDNVMPDCCEPPSPTLWGPKNDISLSIQILRRNHGVFGCWAGGYPIPYNIGWGYTTGASSPGGIEQDLQPLYIAANTGASSPDSGGSYGNPGYEDPDFMECSTSPLPSTPTFVVADRDIYLQKSSFTGTSGTGFGPRGSRPSSSTNGVAWWADDAGGNWWIGGGDANDGCLDIVVAGTWSNCVYTPNTYPHPLATATDFLSFSVSPGSITAGNNFSPAVAVTVNLSGGGTDTAATGTVTLTASGCGITLTPSNPNTASVSSGVATFTGMSAVGTGTGCTLTASISGGTTATDATSGSFNVTAASGSHRGRRGWKGNH